MKPKSKKLFSPKVLVPLVIVLMVLMIPFVMKNWRTKKSPALTASMRLSKSILPTGSIDDLNYELGVRLAKARQFSAAKKVFEDLLSAEPKNMSILNNLAYVSAEADDLTQASDYLQTAIKMADTCAECLNNLGSIYYKQGRVDEARVMFERAIKANPKYNDPKLNLAMLLEQQAEWATALELYKTAELSLTDPTLRKWVHMRALWMSEISRSANRNIAEEP